MKSVSVNKLMALLAAQMLFYGLYLGGLQLVIADIAASYGKGQSGAGLLASAQYITGTLMPMLMGMLADRIGKKKVLVTFSMVFGIGCAVAGISKSVFVYVLGALLIGGGYSVCESLGCAVISELKRDQAGRYINLVQGIFCVGAILGPIMMRSAVSMFGASWRVLFMVCSAAFLITGSMLMPTVFPKPFTKEETASVKGGSGGLFRSAVFISLFAAIILYIGLEEGYGYFVDGMLKERLGDETAGATAISLYWAGMAVCRFIFGMKKTNSRRVLTACFAASAALLAGFVRSGNITLSLALSFCIGAAYGPIWSLLVSEATVRFPEHSAAAAGIMSTGCGIAGIIFPTLIGYILQYAGMEIAVGVLAVTAAVGAYLCLRLPRKS